MDFIRQFEKYSPKIEITGDEKPMILFADFPLLLTNISGKKQRLRYDSVEKEDETGKAVASISVKDVVGNMYRIEDSWKKENNLYILDRVVACTSFIKENAIRLTTEIEVTDEQASSFDDYSFIVPGSMYDKNDTDGDGMDDYLATFNQDYKDDRNPSLSVTVYSKKGNRFVSLIRGDQPERDVTITRDQIRARHFIHDTDVGSLGFMPSMIRMDAVTLRCDYPFYERNTFCLNVDGSEWAAYKKIDGTGKFSMQYILQIDHAEDLTDASWTTTKLQMQRILNPEVKLPFTLKEAQFYRRQMVHNSFREFPEKKGQPAGYFIHFSPRKKYGKQNLLEYGFCGTQTLISYDMLHAYEENKDEEYRRRALRTVDYFVDNCFAESGLPNGIYNVDKEEYVYWWTGILFPFQYSNNRDELENYLGNQVVSSLMSIADELRKVKGNYCRSMIDSMHYLLKCYLLEKQHGTEHPSWFAAVEKFCDKMLQIQNPNGSWNRGYSMEGEPLTNPPQWFGSTEKEIGSGSIFPAQLLVEMYKLTSDRRYLDAAVRAAAFVRDQYVADASYIGGLNDTTHRKSVKIDAVGVMFAMRTLLLVYEACGDKSFLDGAYHAAKILSSWVYLWDIPFDRTTLLGTYGFKTTGWAICDVIPAGSYVDCEFVEFIPEFLRIAEYCHDNELALIARCVTRGMQHGLSMPQNMYGYAMPGVQCEGYMTSLWLADTKYRGFSGAAAKNKGDDNDTSNGLVNGQALLNLDSLERTYGTMDFNIILDKIRNYGGVGDKCDPSKKSGITRISS